MLCWRRAADVALFKAKACRKLPPSWETKISKMKVDETDFAAKLGASSLSAEAAEKHLVSPDKDFLEKITE